MSVKNEGFLHLEFSMISSLNDSYRTIISVYGCDPYMGIQNASKKWTMPIWNWSLTISQLAILFEGRLDESLNL